VALEVVPPNPTPDVPVEPLPPLPALADWQAVKVWWGWSRDTGKTPVGPRTTDASTPTIPDGG
jgi:hypothetical protein